MLRGVRSALMNGFSTSPLPGLAPRSLRLAATLIDTLIGGPLILLWGAAGVSCLGVSLGAFSGGLGQREWMNRAGALLAGSAAWVVFAAASVALGCLVLYQWYLLSTRGQTIGKRLLGIRIVDLDGAPSGFIRALLLRSLVFPSVMSAVVSFSSAVIPFAGIVFLLLNYLPLFGDDRRCLHDYLAGTQVRWVRVLVPNVGRLVVASGSLVLVGAMVALVLNRDAFVQSASQPPVAEPLALAVPIPAPPEPVFQVNVELPKAGSVTGPKAEAPRAPAPPPPAELPPVPEPDQARKLYQFTDQQGVVHVTDDLGTVPEKFRGLVTTL